MHHSGAQELTFSALKKMKISSSSTMTTGGAEEDHVLQKSSNRATDYNLQRAFIFNVFNVRETTL